MEQSREVLARREVDRRLSADGGIHRGKQRGRQLHIANAAQVAARRKPRHVPRYPTA
ncbi:hypothetical protein SDC9_185874 [bioreactor metagenome]|uniref:Uncharacterized protein n=1 Tax=bioreactor metagenome TaxID=1076179 RepID=A0A645HHY9_9ZZZZ